MNTKTLAAFLLVSFASGCVVQNNNSNNPPPPPPPARGDVTFHWTFEGYTCQQTPEVAMVQVIIDGEVLAGGGVYDCLVAGYGGIVLHDFAPGTYTFTLQGLDSQGFVLYEGSGSFAVNGNVEAAVDLGSLYSYAFLSWTLPPTGTHQNPTCDQAGVTTVDIWIDDVAEPRVWCNEGTFGAAVLSRYLAPGQHSIYIQASDEYDYPLYVFSGSLHIQKGPPVSAQYNLTWGVGGAAVSWQLTNGSSTLGCQQAGVDTVYVNFLDEYDQFVYPGAGDPQPCNVAWASYDYLLPGTYEVFIQAASAQYDYESNFNNPPVVTVVAGEWKSQAQAENVLVYRLNP